MRTLKNASIKEPVKVIRLHGDGPIKRRIMDMGITKGCTLYINKVAPLGDPIELHVRDYKLSIRKDYADMIEIG